MRPDGWGGQRQEREHNAIAAANPAIWSGLMSRCPHALLDASEGEVGLPDGQMGNSEVGHLNLGAGRVVMQELPRINAALKDGSLAKTPAILKLISTLKKTGGTCHLMGLLSPGGVHSHQDHIAGLAHILATSGVPVAIHCFLDGRDTPPRSAKGYLAELQAAIGGLSRCTIATVCGRYYAMDRDKRWERTALAYDMLVDARGEGTDSAAAAVAAGYARDESDEFIKPEVLRGYAGMRDGDGILMANFRADRARQMLAALLDPAFGGFPRNRVVQFSIAVGMVEYAESLNPFLETVFPPERPKKILAEVIAAAGLTQLHIAETEKYAHVTFFFNGGEETPFPGEERILVPSPKVATYDLQPEMSAPEVTDRLVASIESGRFDFIVVNYANPDMVGHTGDMDAAVLAREGDRCLPRAAGGGGRAGRRHASHHGRPRQYRIHARSRNRSGPHRPHDATGAACAGQRAGRCPQTGRWPAGRRGADDPGAYGDRATFRDDRPVTAGAARPRRRAHRECRGPVNARGNSLALRAILVSFLTIAAAWVGIAQGLADDPAQRLKAVEAEIEARLTRERDANSRAIRFGGRAFAPPNGSCPCRPYRAGARSIPCPGGRKRRADFK